MGEMCFDLPALDDSNSLLLPESAPKKVETLLASNAEQKNSEKVADQVEDANKKTTITIEMMREEQADRLPVPWNFQQPGATFLDQRFLSASSDELLPIYSVADCKLLLKGNSLKPKRALMPSANLSAFNDCPIPCYLLSTEIGSRASTQNWQKFLVETPPVSVHVCASRFANLHDPTHDGTPKVDFATSAAKIPIQRMLDGVLTSTHDSLSPHCFQSAITENPLLNAFAVAALSDSWLEVSPHMLRSLIDMAIYRYRNAFPGARASQNKEFAQFCAEDTTASTATFSVTLPDDAESIEDDTFYQSSWHSSSYYYASFAPTVASALVGKFTGKPYIVDPHETKTSPGETKCADETLAALEVALASQPTIRIASMYDAAKGISALQNSFVHPGTEPREAKVDATQVHLAVLNTPDGNFISNSTTFTANFDALLRLESKRIEPTSDLEELIRVAGEKDAVLPTEPYSEGTHHLKKLLLTGHYTEWKQFLNRLKEQIRDSPRELQTWLGAMLWMVIYFCKIRDNYKHPEGYGVPKLVSKNDNAFLRAAVGPGLANLFTSEPIHKVEGHAKNYFDAPDVLGFFKRFFWYNPKTDHVGGLAMLFFPFETSLFFTIPNKDPLTKVLTPNHNGALLRALHTFVPHGFPASNIFDKRTSCSYHVNSSRLQTTRTITYGVIGYVAEPSRFAAQQAGEKGSLLIRVVIAAIDNVTAIQLREIVHSLPEPEKNESANRYAIDRSLERFVQFPHLKETEPGKFVAAVERRLPSDSAGFGVSQVAYALSAARLNDTQSVSVLNSFVQDFAKSKSDTVAQVLARRSDAKNNAAQIAAEKQAKLAAEKEAKLVAEKEAKLAAAEKEAKLVAEKEAKLAKEAERKRKIAIDIARSKAQKKQEKQQKGATEPKKPAHKVDAQLAFDEKLARDLQKGEFSLKDKDDMTGFVEVSRKGKKKQSTKPTNDQIKKALPLTVEPLPLIEPTLIKPVHDDSKPSEPLSVVSFITDFSQPLTTVCTTRVSVEQISAQPEPTLTVQEPVQEPEAVQEPAVQEPAVQEPAVQEPAVQGPAVQETFQEAVQAESLPLIANAPLQVESPHTPKSVHFSLESVFRIDHQAQKRYLQSFRLSVQHARLWLQLAAIDRPFSHQNSVPFENRVALTPAQTSCHLSGCSDGSVTLSTPWSILMTAFDGQCANTLPGRSMDTVILNGNGDAQANDPILSNIGDYIFTSVVNNACFTPGDSGANGACFTCLVCHRAQYSRFAFVPEYINNEHTIASRMIPMCTSPDCSSLLLKKVGDRSHKDRFARFPGLRVFFHFNGTVVVCESESNTYKLCLGESNGITFSKSTLGQGITNSDFSSVENAIFVTDSQGYVFALPPVVAEKAHCLANFLTCGVSQN